MASYDPDQHHAERAGAQQAGFPPHFAGYGQHPGFPYMGAGTPPPSLGMGMGMNMPPPHPSLHPGVQLPLPQGMHPDQLALFQMHQQQQQEELMKMMKQGTLSFFFPRCRFLSWLELLN